MATLYQLTQEFLDIEDVLYESGGELTPELETALTETRESLMAKVDSYNALIQKLGSMADSASSEIARLGKLKKTAENAQKRLKERIIYHMNEFGIGKLEGNLCKMSLRSSKSLNVDESLLMAKVQEDVDKLRAKLPEYMTVEVKVSKTAIKDAEKLTGMIPEGCSYVFNESLLIR